jgi:hypothetical protein
MAGNLNKKEAVVVRIQRTISGPRKDTSFSYGRELAKARSVVEKIINDGDRKLIKYILSVAKPKIKSDDLFVTKIKKTYGKMVKSGASAEKVRMINMYINNLGPDGAKRFIGRFQ